MRKGVEDAAIVAVIILLVAAMVVYYMFTKGYPTTPEPKPPCIVTGCSGQVCSDEDVITTCEWRDEYACYRTARCERQSDGRCGWTPTAELQVCLNQYK